MFPTAGDIYHSIIAGSGRYGRLKIDATGVTAPASREVDFFCILPITDDFEYGDDCEARRGDAPADGDAAPQGVYDMWPGKKVVAGAGQAWVYTEDKQKDNVPEEEPESPESPLSPESPESPGSP